MNIKEDILSALRYLTADGWNTDKAIAPCIAAYFDIAKGMSVLPEHTKWFTGFKSLRPEQISVVILGQDPYPTRGKAVGRSFGLPHGWPKINSSILNIKNRVEETQGGKLDLTLESWQNQGVLCLNTRLTVIEGKPMSHAGIGWEKFVKSILVQLDSLPNPPVLLLWGAEAQKMAHGLKNCPQLKTSHPCKFSAHRGFLKMNHFSETNEILASRGQSPIKWTI